MPLGHGLQRILLKWIPVVPGSRCVVVVLFFSQVRVPNTLQLYVSSVDPLVLKRLH
jgi:hypothetical protein